MIARFMCIHFIQLTGWLTVFNSVHSWQHVLSFGWLPPPVNLKKNPSPIPLIGTIVQLGVFSFHTYQTKYHHPKYDVTMVSQLSPSSKQPIYNEIQAKIDNFAKKVLSIGISPSCFLQKKMVILTKSQWRLTISHVSPPPVQPSLKAYLTPPVGGTPISFSSK